MTDMTVPEISPAKTRFGVESPSKRRSENRLIAMIKHLKRMSAKVNDYEKLLQELSMRVAEDDASAIRAVLGKFGSAPSGTPTPTGPKEDDMDDNAYLSDVSSAGSLGAIGHAGEDYDRSEDTRTTGFLGQSSEITWMQKLKVEVGQFPQVPEPCSQDMSNLDVNYQEDISVYSVSYHLDDLKIQDKEAVDPFELPDCDAAEKLLEAYLVSVHPSFPILEKRFLISQYNLIYKNKASFDPGRKTLAILNLVFAIAAKYSHLTLTSWAADIRDHLVYFTRARMLSMDGNVLFSHPDIQQIQVEGLISFYLIATGQINRAWRISSIPLRSAIALGLNLKNTAPDIDPALKEFRYRIWWSLLIIERLLGNMTGRPTCLMDGVSTLPLPLPFEEDRFQEEEISALLNDVPRRNTLFPGTESRVATTQSTGGSSEPVSPQQSTSSESKEWLHSIPPNDSLYFYYSTDLTLLAQDVLNQLYTTKAAQTPWPEIIQTITSLQRKINTWFSNLPPCYDFTDQQHPHIYRKEKLRLAMLYYSSKILITRPCLCRVSRRDPQSRKPNDESVVIAAECVESACSMLRQLPDVPDAISLNQSSPWWCLIHYLMQATTILLLELSFHSQHVPGQTDKVSGSAKKAILWLHDMAKYSATSQRAWALCDDFARRLAPHIALDMNDLPSTLTPHVGRPAPPESPNMSIDPPQQPFTAVDQSIGHLSGPFSGDVHFPPSNDYDEFLPFDPVTGEITGSLFPNTMDPDFHFPL
ncbi:hypothetical protein FQN54_009502 [Arachnomyces sp. PD_36]|nr:hypothetical protein FQN54_009502 [Arachnomyces sp. PD_36]